jgi:transposase
MESRGNPDAPLEEVRAIEARSVELERTLPQQAGADASVRRAMAIPGIGLLTATAARAQGADPVAGVGTAVESARLSDLVNERAAIAPSGFPLP